MASKYLLSLFLVVSVNYSRENNALDYQIINKRDANGNTALHQAVNTYNLPEVESLLARGANTSLFNRDGRRPIDLAISNLIDLALQSKNFSTESQKTAAIWEKLLEAQLKQ